MAILISLFLFIIGLYFICSSILMSILVRNNPDSIDFKLFIFGLLVCPVAFIYEIWNDYIE